MKNDAIASVISVTNGAVVYIVHYSIWPFPPFMASSCRVWDHVTVQYVAWDVNIFLKKVKKSSTKPTFLVLTSTATVF